jgi:signal transduction histidine kinase
MSRKPTQSPAKTSQSRRPQPEHPAVLSQDRYQAFIRHSSEGIWCCELDTPIDTTLPADEQIKLMYKYAYVAEANDAMAAMYGLPNGDALLGMRLPALLVQDDPRNMAFLRAFIAADYALSGVDSHEVDVRGHDKYFRNSLVGEVEHGTVLRAWGTQQDITQQYVALQALESAKDELHASEAINAALKSQQAQLVELNNSKDEFISLASHQLRTPATGVKQYIGMLLEGYCGAVTSQQRDFLEIAYESNERQLRIIDDLLKVAHVDAGKITLIKEATNLTALISEVVAEQSSVFARRNQKIAFACAAEEITACVDVARMHMVLDNLIDNASKYSLPGKIIIVQLDDRPDEVEIHIKDQGVGIAKKDIAKLFQKFARVSNELSTLVGGTGLGLYWAKKIVDLHKGTIRVESRPHRGSDFIVTLPKR